MRARDLTGQKFASLTAVKRVAGAEKSTWLCSCDCGRTLEVRQGNLASGNSKSCGCRVPDVARGWVRTPEYTAFRNAKNRCERPQDVRFPLYGGRGIQFKFEDMAAFIAAVGPRPSAGHSLDRINPDGHYEAGNVRWATRAVQARNKSDSLLVKIDGVTRPLKDWCDQYGQPYKRVWERMRDGATALEALTRPPKRWGSHDETFVQVEALA